jgi:hypothetical protein
MEQVPVDQQDVVKCAEGYTLLDPVLGQRVRVW